MKNDDRLQIPINKKLKKDFKTKCESYGFSSINEALRVLVHNFTYENLSPLNLLQRGQKNKDFYIDPYVEIADEETEKAIGEAYAAHKRGEFITINPNEKINIDKLLEGIEDV